MSDVNKDRHIISILLDNEAGALSRVAGLFSARGYNIESLTVAATDNPSLSRITIVTFSDGELIKQIINQLNKLIDVAEVQSLSEDEFIEREVLLVKVQCSDTDSELANLEAKVQQYGGVVIECKRGVCLFELTASSRQIEDLLSALRDWKLLEVVRSGVTGLGRGAIILQI